MSRLWLSCADIKGSIEFSACHGTSRLKGLMSGLHTAFINLSLLRGVQAFIIGQDGKLGLILARRLGFRAIIEGWFRRWWLNRRRIVSRSTYWPALIRRSGNWSGDRRWFLGWCVILLFRVFARRLLDVLLFLFKHALVCLGARLRKMLREAFKFFYLFNSGLGTVLNRNCDLSPHHSLLFLVIC